MDIKFCNVFLLTLIFLHGVFSIPVRRKREGYPRTGSTYPRVFIPQIFYGPELRDVPFTGTFGPMEDLVRPPLPQAPRPTYGGPNSGGPTYNPTSYNFARPPLWAPRPSYGGPNYGGPSHGGSFYSTNTAFSANFISRCQSGQAFDVRSQQCRTRE